MIYDFLCRSCGIKFQKDLPINKTHRPRCPKCRSRKTRKVIHRADIIFKGSGFYATDHRK